MVWKNWEFGNCPHCGNIAEVDTDAEDGFANDGGRVRCVECGCPGGITADFDEDIGAIVNWHDEPNCECDWCKSHPV